MAFEFVPVRAWGFAIVDEIATFYTHGMEVLHSLKLKIRKLKFRAQPFLRRQFVSQIEN